MRFVLNLLILLMLTGLLAGAVYLYQQDHERERNIEQTRDQVRRIEQQIKLQGTLGDLGLTDRGYPATLDPDWFDPGLPLNALLSAAHPWVEIAHEDQAALSHPLDPVARYRSQAQFWYNPYTGIIRARVPAMPSDRSTLELYNRVNGSRLTSLFDMTTERETLFEPVNPPRRSRSRR